ncbi:MAG: hypothetical protein ABJA71_06450 [Ginsengibacter sp.]
MIEATSEPMNLAIVRGTRNNSLVTNNKGKSLFTFSLLGNNLFDVAYQSHLNRLKYFESYPDDPRPYHGIYNMGRNFSVRINVSLVFASK